METIMAKSSVVIERINLSLNVQEATYLRSVLQNPHMGLSLDEEPQDIQDSRSAIWSELNNCLEIADATV